ncbi:MULTISPECIES: TRAP transporter substrate-binding protein DctP [Chelativorans]|uniref:TRAP dicarboxylate transporter-DctP subunit n=1 Tax=Chelativorans sp. (strain BNC1) TaxID=266779 RepID=Q11AP4_CHESB|nr:MULTISPECIES: TRAP transporter substrate-binding protein DctP [Chelativorans]
MASKGALQMFARALGLTLVAACSITHVTAQEYTLDMANEYNTNSIVGRADAHFAELVAEKTGGRVRVVVHFSGALGIKSEDVIDSVGTGAVSLANFPLEVGAGHSPLYSMTNLPLFGISLSQAIVMQEVAKPYLTDVMKEDNIVPLYFTIWPPIGLWSDQPIQTAEDLKGLRVRVTQPITAELFKAAGSAPVQLSWADVVPQLMTGALDAVHTSIQGLSLGLPAKDVPHFMDFGSHVSQNAAVINADLLQSFPEDIRAAILEAGVETEQWSHGMIAEIMDLEYKRLSENNVTLVKQENVPSDLMSFFRQISEPLVANWQAKAGEVGARFLAEYQGRIR